jgi:ribokinase
MNKNIAVFGSLTVDLFVQPSETQIITQSTENTAHSLLALPHGGKISAEHIQEHFGGGASNVGVSFSRLENSVTCFGGIGDDSNGEKILKNLEKENIITENIQKFSGKKSGFSLILNAFDGERTVIFTSEANKEFGDISTEKIPENFDALYLCHISGKNPEKLFEKIQNFLEKNPEKKFFWNPGKERIAEGLKDKTNQSLLQSCNVLFVNTEEAEKFSGILSKSEHTSGEELRKKHLLYEENAQKKIPSYVRNVSEIAQKFLERGVETVVITDGRKGAQVFSQKKNISPREKHLFIPCFPGKRIDTLGAGDSFASCFSSFYLQGEPLQNCGKYASINATSVVEYQGAQDGLLTKKQVQSFTK